MLSYAGNGCCKLGWLLCCVLCAGRAADVPVKKARILHGKQLAVLISSLMPGLVARIYVHVNVKQQGGWLKENSLCKLVVV